MTATTGEISASNANRKDIDQLSARWLARVLRAGVLTAGALILIGIGIFLFSDNQEPSTLDQALGKEGDLAKISLSGLWHGVLDGEAASLIQLGILVLVLTPTLRVGVTLVIFALQRDRVFIGLTVIVLVILILGLVGIGA
jgi:uncharacterized membrane protein